MQTLKLNYEIDNTIIGKNINIHKQNPVCDGCYIVSHRNDVIKSGYCESNLDYDNVNWFVDEVKKNRKEYGFFKKH